VYDACVLYPNTLRDLLIRIAQSGLCQAKWTDQILGETFKNLQASRPELDESALVRTRELMIRAVRDCLVQGYEALIPVFTLPDPDDRHVLAAAVRAKAQLIVTANLRDFPVQELSQWDVEAKAPDDFVLDQIDLDRAAVYGAVQRIADSWKKPPGTINDVLSSLEKCGLVESVAALRA